jgi:tetratricopeptide (TPR) repeat protein
MAHVSPTDLGSFVARFAASTGRRLAGVASGAWTSPHFHQWVIAAATVIGTALTAIAAIPTVRDLVWAADSASLEEAIALAGSHRDDEALAAFARLVRAEPLNPVIHANLCAAQLLADRLLEARQSCAQALRLAPRSWLANYNQACVLVREGRHAEAIGAIELALETVADDSRAPLSRTALAAQAAVDVMLRPLRDDARFRKAVALP